MATIVIRDLQESVELDRKAMLAISGGARLRARLGSGLRAASHNTRVVDFRTPGSKPGAAPK